MEDKSIRRLLTENKQEIMDELRDALRYGIPELTDQERITKMQDLKVLADRAKAAMESAIARRRSEQ